MSKQSSGNPHNPASHTEHPNGYSPELFLRTLIEHAPNAIFAVRNDGTFIEMNSLAAQALGGIPQDFLGKQMGELFPPEHANRQLESICRVIKTQKGEVHRRPTIVNGEQRWFVTTIQPLPDSNGKPDTALCVSTDISETIERNQMLQRERDFNKTILQTANCLIFALDEEGRVAVFNSECERLSGYKASEVLGKVYHEIFLPPEAIHAGHDNFGQWVREHPRDTYEGPWVTKSGEILTIYWSTSSFEIEATGELVAIAIGVDITERKRTEKALRLHAFAFENISDAVMVTDADGKIVQFNSGAESLLGYKSEEAIDMYVGDLVAADVAERLNQEIWEQVSKGNRWSGVVKGTRKDGSAAYSDTAIIPVIDESGERISIVSVSHDITPHRELEQKLKNSEAHKSAILEALPDMVFVLNRDGICLDFKGVPNEPPIAPPQEFIGKKAYKWMPKRIGSKILKKTQAAIDSGETQILEYSLSLPQRTGDYEARFVRSGNNTCVALVRNITERKLMESKLDKANRDLKHEHEELNDANTTLRGMVRLMESESNRVKEQVIENVDKQITPLIEQLKQSCAELNLGLLKQIETELREITSPFTRTLANLAGNLTRRELQIASMIRTGSQTKEIAETLRLSTRTVEKTRQNIRRKLGITNSEINLASHLENLIDILRK